MKAKTVNERGSMTDGHNESCPDCAGDVLCDAYLDVVSSQHGD